jgi:RecA/RadA recombinase
MGLIKKRPDDQPGSTNEDILREQAGYVQEVEKAIAEPTDNEIVSLLNRRVEVKQVISTGSTLLDLSICGEVIRGGGIPGGLLVEIYGRAGLGKTAILSEICASAQSNGGKVRFTDPEARLNKEYTRIYGVDLSKKFEYYRPDTVKELFNDYLTPWETNTDSINVFASDSIAALSTEMEMEEEDKRGQQRAKDFSQGLRKNARSIVDKNILMIFTNQVRAGERGDITPGGMGIPFYASIRLAVKQPMLDHFVKKSKNIGGSKREETIGIKSEITVVKNSVGISYRKCPIYIMNNYGVDDLRANLQYYKEMMGQKSYDVIDRTYISIIDAIHYIEDHNLEEKLRERTIDTWEMIFREFQEVRKPKKR